MFMIFICLNYIFKYVNEVILIRYILPFIYLFYFSFYFELRLFCACPGGDEEQKSPVKEKKHREKGDKGFFGLFKDKKTSEQVCTPVSLFGFAICATFHI